MIRKKKYYHYAKKYYRLLEELWKDQNVKSHQITAIMLHKFPELNAGMILEIFIGWANWSYAKKKGRDEKKPKIESLSGG